MTSNEALAIIHGSEGDEDEAYQHLINTGEVWEQEDWIGKNAAALIAVGHCHGPARETR